MHRWGLILPVCLLASCSTPRPPIGAFGDHAPHAHHPHVAERRPRDAVQRHGEREIAIGIGPRPRAPVAEVTERVRQDTAAGPAGVAAQLFPFVLLPLDEDIADLIERDYCAPKVTIPAGTIHGQKEPCLTVTNPGFELIVNKDLPDDVAYLMAKALDQSSVEAFAAQDVFYSVRHAPKSTAPLHPGAARYYREQGVLK